LCDPPLHGRVFAVIQHGPEAATESEQVLDGNRPRSGYGVIEGAVDVAQHARVGELGKPAIDSLTELQPPFVHQHQRDCRGDGLGHRGDAKQAVTLHEPRRFERLVPDDHYLGMGTVANEGHGTRQVAGLNVALENFNRPASAQLQTPRLERGGHQATT